MFNSKLNNLKREIKSELLTEITLIIREEMRKSKSRQEEESSKKQYQEKNIPKFKDKDKVRTKVTEYDSFPIGHYLTYKHREILIIGEIYGEPKLLKFENNFKYQYDIVSDSDRTIYSILEEDIKPAI
jgi:hypothetical protein